MAHILLIDVPGGNDFTVLEDALRDGHEVTFFTSDLAHYQAQGEITASHLSLAHEVVEVAPFTFDHLEQAVLPRHAQKPFDAVICIIDIRQVEASQIAERLGLRYFSPETALLMRDKFNVRQKLNEAGIKQPAFGLAQTVSEIREVVSKIDFPVVVKPVDGYASQNISIIRSEIEFDIFCSEFENNYAGPTDYGLGVHANNRFSVEQYIEGTLIGCDVFSDGEDRVLIGINEKLMFPLPSFAIRGGHFPSHTFDTELIRSYAFSILDALGLNFGAVHIEMIVSDGVPYLVEVNARLVSAQIPFQMAYALERSLYLDLIDLHLGVPILGFAPFDEHWVSVIRWIVADRSGILQAIHSPSVPDPAIRRVIFFKAKGDAVCPPMSNGDRIGYVIATAPNADDAAKLAENYVANTALEIVA